MKRMIDAEKFLDKLLYMGYMDEQKSEVEEVANRMIEEAYTKDEVVAMLTEIQLELDEMKITKVRSAGFAPYSKDPFRRGVNCSKEVIQQKINALMKGKDKDENR